MYLIHYLNAETVPVDSFLEVVEESDEKVAAYSNTKNSKTVSNFYNFNKKFWVSTEKSPVGDYYTYYDYNEMLDDFIAEGLSEAWEVDTVEGTIVKKDYTKAILQHLVDIEYQQEHINGLRAYPY